MAYPYFRITAVKVKDLKQYIEFWAGKGYDALSRDPEVKLKVNQAYAYWINQPGGPVPFRPDGPHSGRLREHCFVTGDGRVVWSAPYAKNTYEGILSTPEGDPLRPIKKWSTPGTGDHWVEEFPNKTHLYEDFLLDVGEIVVEAINKQNG